MVRSKTNAYRQLTEILTENNIRVSWEDVLNGGPHGRRAEDEVQRKHIFEAIALKGYTKTWQEAKLLVRDNPAYNVRREKIDPAEAIKIILDAGGIPILAHPNLIDETVYRDGEELMPRAAYIERLIEAGLMGIEAIYPYDKTQLQGKQDQRADQPRGPPRVWGAAAGDLGRLGLPRGREEGRRERPHDRRSGCGVRLFLRKSLSFGIDTELRPSRTSGGGCPLKQFKRMREWIQSTRSVCAGPAGKHHRRGRRAGRPLHAA